MSRHFVFLVEVVNVRVVSGKGSVDDTQKSDYGQGALAAGLGEGGWVNRLC